MKPWPMTQGGFAHNCIDSSGVAIWIDHHVATPAMFSRSRLEDWLKTRGLEGKVAIISGGAQGMGAAHVRRLAADGASVVFGDINHELGLKLERSVRDSGGLVHFHHLDVSVSSDWEKLVEWCENNLGRLDVLVNNAGVLQLSDAIECSEEEWSQTINVNQRGVFLSLKHCVPLMKRSGGGSIINISSIYGLVGAVGYIAYTASKGAVTLMTKSAAATYGPYGIRVNSIHPGVIRTAMLEAELSALPDGAIDDFLAVTPLRREGSAEEVSGCVSFLASGDSSFVSGAELVVDGGLLSAR